MTAEENRMRAAALRIVECTEICRQPLSQSADSHCYLDRSSICLAYARARAHAKRCCSGEFAPYCIPVATSACKPHNFKMEFNMLAPTKQASIAIAVTLALSLPLAPAFSASAPSTAAMQNQAAPA